MAEGRAACEARGRGEASGQRAGALLWLRTRPGQGQGEVKAGGTPGWGGQGVPGVPGVPAAAPGRARARVAAASAPARRGLAETKAGGEQKAEGNKGDSCGVAGLAAGGLVSGLCLFLSANLDVLMLLLPA